MFRNINRKKKILSNEETLRILTDHVRGVLAVQGDDGYPYALPINYYYDPVDGALYFHSGKFGHKIDAMNRCDKVSFCVYDEGYHEEGDWALTIKSVIVFGRAEAVTDIGLAEQACRKLSAQFPVSKEETDEEIAKSLAATYVFRVVPEHITGKWVREA